MNFPYVYYNNQRPGVVVLKRGAFRMISRRNGQNSGPLYWLPLWEAAYGPPFGEAPYWLPPGSPAVASQMMRRISPTSGMVRENDPLSPLTPSTLGTLLINNFKAGVLNAIFYIGFCSWGIVFNINGARR